MDDFEGGALKDLDAIEHVAAVLLADALELHDRGQCGVIEATGAGHADAPLGAHGLENAEWEPVVREDEDGFIAGNIFPGKPEGSQIAIGWSFPVDRFGCRGQFPRRAGFRPSK